jgi:hypothetical protein
MALPLKMNEGTFLLECTLECAACFSIISVGPSIAMPWLAVHGAALEHKIGAPGLLVLEFCWIQQAPSIRVCHMLGLRLPQGFAKAQTFLQDYPSNG